MDNLHRKDNLATKCFMQSVKMFQIAFFLCLWNVHNTYAFSQISGIPGPVLKTQEDTTAAGNWSGTSICQQKNSGCHDEQAYYHISKTGSPLVYQVTGYKIIDGKKVNMGILNFNYDITSHILTCTNRNGIWTLEIKGNTMEGEMRTPDKILFRKILLTKTAF